MDRKERLSAFNRGNILDAAKRLFLEKGIVNTTMDDISKEADYSKSTVYTYFKSKDEIYTHIILEHFKILKTAISESLCNAPGFPEGFYAICDAMLRSFKTSPLFFESLLGEIKLPGDDSAEVLTQIFTVGEEINTLIWDYLKKCTEAGHIQIEIPLKIATFALWASISGTIVMAHKKEAYINLAMGISKEEFMQDGFRMLLNSIQS